MNDIFVCIFMFYFATLVSTKSSFSIHPVIVIFKRFNVGPSSKFVFTSSSFLKGLMFHPQHLLFKKVQCWILIIIFKRFNVEPSSNFVYFSTSSSFLKGSMLDHPRHHFKIVQCWTLIKVTSRVCLLFPPEVFDVVGSSVSEEKKKLLLKHCQQEYF